jgi:hypothetical protein
MRATASVLGSGTISCRLQAGANFDETQAFVADGEPAPLSLRVLNTYAAAGTADFSCSGARQAGELREDHRHSGRDPEQHRLTGRSLDPSLDSARVQ